MITKDEIAKIGNFVLDYLLKTGEKKLNDVWGPKYRWEHTLRVAYWARRLAVAEGADIEKCVVAALFHDVSHFVSEDYRKHGVRSAEVAKDFLIRENFDENFMKDVAYAVESHVGEANPKTLEARILQDADTLDRFGYFRILMFGKDAQFEDRENLRRKVQSSLEYVKRVGRGEFGPMWTEMGEDEMKRRIRINLHIMSGVLDELEKTKAPETYA